MAGATSRSRGGGSRVALRVLLGAYAALLALVGLLPTPVDRPAHRSLGRFVAWCAAHGLGFVDYARI